MKKFIVIFLFAALLLMPVSAHALTSSQIASIINLLTSFGADEAAVSNVASVLYGSQDSNTASVADSNTAAVAQASPDCVPPLFEYTLEVGSYDENTNGEVSKLQGFLTRSGDYTYPEITGYFGLSTQTAVQKWQARNGVVLGGSPETTGYGVVGPQTRAALAQVC